MTDIVERNIQELRKSHGEYGVQRLRDLLIAEENFYTIREELGVSLVVLGFLSKNLPAFLRAVEAKRSSLRLVYVRAA